jgi:catechol 2,3-dioxygenase-like lactoylglutathione lyase family enzyme
MDSSGEDRAILGLLPMAERRGTLPSFKSPTAERGSPFRSHGLSHVSLAVKDPERSLRFYSQAFGVDEYYRDETSIQVKGPGFWDVIAFEKNAALAGKKGGITHFGIRLVDPGDIDRAIDVIERAGGKVLRRGEFSPGFPFAYVADPDGYEIEIWYE